MQVTYWKCHKICILIHNQIIINITINICNWYFWSKFRVDIYAYHFHLKFSNTWNYVNDQNYWNFHYNWKASEVLVCIVCICAYSIYVHTWFAWQVRWLLECMQFRAHGTHLSILTYLCVHSRSTTSAINSYKFVDSYY